MTASQLEGDEEVVKKAPQSPEAPAGQRPKVGFAPADLSDGRPVQEPFADAGEEGRVATWRSRYTEFRCIAQIWAEALYLALALAAAAAALLLVWLGTPQDWLDVTDTRYLTFQIYAYAWAAGVLGGTLFSAKWLYHSVGKGKWNVDRLAWRLFTPPLSGALAFVLIALASSGIVNILSKELLRSPPAIVGLGFVFGYFSDFTVARLYQLAEKVLGASNANEPGPAEADAKV